MAVKVYKPEYPGLYYFDTFTFTTLGTSGNRGPESTKGYANGTVYTSTDGVSWQSYQLQGDAPSECNRIIYISKYKAFFVLSGQAGSVHKSYDGVEWTVVYQSPGVYLSEMVWCPTFNSILIFSIANNLTQLTFSN